VSHSDELDLKEVVIFHKRYNLKGINLIQTKFRERKSSSKRFKIRRFKQLFSAYLTGWKVRRILAFVKAMPEMLEAIDIIRLRNGISETEEDLFTQKILEKYQDMVTKVYSKFTELYNEGTWLQIPIIEETPIKKKLKANKATKRSHVRVNLNRLLMYLDIKSNFQKERDE